MHQSGKTYGHELGFSCAFRQPFANSHCSKVHGYALSFRLLFEADHLDRNGWVVDFGALKPIKKMLEDRFDHKLIISKEDPHLQYFQEGYELGVLDLVVMPGVGCENFAEHVYHLTAGWLFDNGYHVRGVRLVSVKVAEHGANHATYINPTLDISKKANTDV